MSHVSKDSACRLAQCLPVDIIFVYCPCSHCVSESLRTILPNPKPVLSATRFIAKPSCERVHMLCPVPALHPDNYCYIYPSKMRAESWRDYRVEQRQWGEEGEGAKAGGRLGEKMRKKKKGRRALGEGEVMEACCKLTCVSAGVEWAGF